jgi:hypothetical protein
MCTVPDFLISVCDAQRTCGGVGGGGGEEQWKVGGFWIKGR